MDGCSPVVIISICGLVLLDVSLGSHYTDLWAVHIKGGLQVAESLAKKHGYNFIGEIMPDYYHFQHRKVAKRSIYPSMSHQYGLEKEKNIVIFFIFPIQPPHARMIKIYHTIAGASKSADNKNKYSITGGFDRLIKSAMYTSSPVQQKVLWLQQQVAKRRVKRSIQFNDPKWPIMWYLNRGNGLDMNVRRAWLHGYTGKGVVVTILDDGIEKDNPDLKRNYDEQASYDVNGHDPDPQPRYDISNENRHGTRCAGEVAAQADNYECNVGVAFDAKIGGVRMLDGDVTDSVEAQSLSHNPQHIHIYSASWGPDDDGRTVDGPATLAIKAFFDGITKGRGGLGSIFVWASGNGGRDDDSCNCDGYTNSIYTLSISSATENGNIPWYSEACSSTLATTYSSGSGEERQIVTTDLRRGCTEKHTGTSASAPLAAGLCALALQANPMLTWRDMQHVVVMTAKPENLNAPDWSVNGVGRKVSHSFGYGLMDAAAMVALARNWTTVPKQQICEIRSADHNKVVPLNGKATVALYTSGCKGKHNYVKYLEHVQARVTLSSSRRGEIQIFLTSPMGTKSTLLARRIRDGSRDGFNNWAFMTTHNWGEFAKGTWILEIVNGDSTSELKEWALVIMGTATHPRSHNTTPPPHHEFPKKQPYACAGVSTSSVCIECQTGFYKLEKKCVASCPVQYFGHVEIVMTSDDLTVNKTRAICSPCDKACAKCKGPTTADCFTCNNNYNFKDGYCKRTLFLDFMNPKVLEYLIWAVVISFCIVTVIFIVHTVHRFRNNSVCCQCWKEKARVTQPTRGKYNEFNLMPERKNDEGVHSRLLTENDGNDA